MAYDLLLLNPPKRGRKARRQKRRRRMTAKQLKYFGKRRRRRRAAPVQGVQTVARHRKSNRTRSRRRSGRRRRGFFGAPVARRGRRRRAGRRNGSGIFASRGGFVDTSLLLPGVGAAVGVIGASMGLDMLAAKMQKPGQPAPAWTTGWGRVGTQLAITLAIAFAAKRARQPKLAAGVTVGGIGNALMQSYAILRPQPAGPPAPAGQNGVRGIRGLGTLYLPSSPARNANAYQPGIVNSRMMSNGSGR